MKDSRLYLEHILEAIILIEQYSEGLDFKKFSQDRMIQDSIIRRLEIIGEASNRVPPETKDRLSEVPWKKMLGMRNIIVHDYMGVDLDKVWEVVDKDITPLKKQIQEALNKI